MTSFAGKGRLLTSHARSAIFGPEADGQEDRAVDRILIGAYQYVIARFDCDGFRIDTFKVPDPAFGHTFCAAMREFGLSIGKENFFTFGRDHGGGR